MLYFFGLINTMEPVVETSVDPIVDPSGSVIDISGTVVDPSGSVVDPSGSIMYLNSGLVLLPPKPDILSLEDLISDSEVLAQQEQQHKADVEGISSMTTTSLKPMLLQWAKQGFPGLFEIYRLTITPPTVCSDGIVRGLGDYIEFCSGKPLHEHVDELKKKLTGMDVGFVNYGTYISIVVSKA